MKEKETNGFVAVCKFLAVTLILIMHCWLLKGNGHPYFEGAYIYCDFFFIIIGFYLRPIMGENLTSNVLQWLKNKYRKWVPLIFVESILLFLVELFSSVSTLIDVIKNTVGAFIDVSLISMLLVKSYGLNDSLWFLSAALWGGTIVVAMISNRKIGDSIKLYGGVSLVIYLIFLCNIGEMDSWGQQLLGFFPNDSILRSIGGISLGYCLSLISAKLKVKNSSMICVRIVSIGSFAATILFSYIFAHGLVDFIDIILFSTSILANSLDKNWLNGRAFNFLNNLQFPYYVFQVFSIHFTIYYVTGVITSVLDILVVFLIAVIISAAYNLFLRSHVNYMMERMIRWYENIQIK